jgi:hypothetical protein
MLERASEKGKITTEELTRMKDIIENSRDKGDRVPKEDSLVVDELKLEFKKLKIENKSDQTAKTGSDEKTNGIHFNEQQRRSRWQDWTELKNKPNFNNFKRSASKPGMWKNPQGDYRRAPSRPPSRRPFERRQSRPFERRQSRPFSRGASAGRTPSEGRTEPIKLMDRVIKLEDSMTKILNTQKESMKKMEELFKKTKNVGWVLAKIEEKEIQVEISGVMFLKEVQEIQAMILETGWLKSLVGKQWLEKYLKKMKLKESELKKTACSQKFRFGPSKVYEAKEVIEIPITVKINDMDETFTKIKLGTSPVWEEYND